MLFRIKSFKWFILCHILYLYGIFHLIYVFGKTESHLLINEWHNPQLDIFFSIITDYGDTLFILAVIIAALFIRFQYSISLIISVLTTTMLVQPSKFFFMAQRPLSYFSDLGLAEQLHRIPWVELHSYLSFPSGHAATIWAFSTVLSCYSQSHLAKGLLALSAAAIAFSRVYIHQHFLIDIAAGSILGIISGILAYFITKRINNPILYSNIFSLIRKN